MRCNVLFSLLLISCIFVESDQDSLLMSLSIELLGSFEVASEYEK